MKRITLVLFFLWAMNSIAQEHRYYPEDIIVVPHWDIGMTHSYFQNFIFRTANDFVFEVYGSNGDVYKTQPHVYPIEGSGHVRGGKLQGELVLKHTDSYRGYPSIRLSSNYVKYAPNLLIEQITGSGFLGIVFFNPETGLQNEFPQDLYAKSLVALSQTPYVVDQKIYVLAGDCDVYSPSGNYRDYNILDRDSLYLMRFDFGKADFVKEHSFNLKGLTGKEFQRCMGEFDFDPQLGKLRFQQADTLFLFEVGRPNPTQVYKPPFYRNRHLKNLADTNYFVGRSLFSADHNTSYGEYLMRTSFDSNYQESRDSLAYYYPSPNLRSDSLQYKYDVIGITEERVYLSRQKAFYDEVGTFYDNTLICTNWQGEKLWSRDMLSRDYRGHLEEVFELNDTLFVLGRIKFPSPYKPEYFIGPSISFIRRLTKDGKLIDWQQVDPDIQVYPNPFQVDFFIELDGLRSIQLFNQTGLLIHEEKVLPGDYKYQCFWPDLDIGLYVLRLEDKDGNHFQRKLLKR
ncbi:T9SS type A sorting domain-containing protein [Croceimicrobium sp.]|uniref:T9SS type A sorting domain-containing protein n=1 Tax=Croceimicrobium sp. TaxID=2828340 RepID=UPI003BAB0F75